MDKIFWLLSMNTVLSITFVMQRRYSEWNVAKTEFTSFKSTIFGKITHYCPLLTMLVRQNKIYLTDHDIEFARK